MILNYKLYQEIKSKGREEISKESWFNVSAKVFQSHGIENEEDLIKLIAFAYSWMPTIPSYHVKEIDIGFLIANLKKLRKNEEFDIEQTLRNLIPLTNKSIVGASKVLFFVNNQIIPIIDSRVVACWNKQIADKEKGLKIRNIDSKDIDKKIDSYLHYWDSLKIWQKKCAEENRLLSIRDLETALYNYENSNPFKIPELNYQSLL